MSAPTLRDLAQLAGVSVTTVSKALRNDPKISEKRRHEIAALARRAGYRPNPALSAWMRHVRDVRHSPSVETIAYVTTRPLAETVRKTETWAYRYHSGAVRMARRLGYECATFSIVDHQGDWERLFDILHHRGVRGVGIDPLTGLRPPPVGDARFCLASIESMGPDKPADWVSTDHFAGMILALEQAWKHGHRRIGFVRSAYATAEHERWRAAFALWQTGMPKTRQIPIMDEQTLASAPDKVRQWAERHGPTVIISSNNAAPGLFRAAGMQIPRDVAFISLDQIQTQDRIAGVVQGMEEVGAALIRILAMKLELNETGPAVSPRSLLLQPTWVDGASLP